MTVPSVVIVLLLNRVKRHSITLASSVKADFLLILLQLLSLSLLLLFYTIVIVVTINAAVINVIVVSITNFNCSLLALQFTLYR